MFSEDVIGIYTQSKFYSDLYNNKAVHWWHGSLLLAYKQSAGIRSQIIQEIHYNPHRSLLKPGIQFGNISLPICDSRNRVDEVVSGAAIDILPKWRHALDFAQAVKSADIAFQSGLPVFENSRVVNCNTGVNATCRIIGHSVDPEVLQNAPGADSCIDIDFPVFDLDLHGTQSWDDLRSSTIEVSRALASVQPSPAPEKVFDFV